MARLTGRIRKWFGDKGIGFIIPDEGGDDMFVHHTSCKVEDNQQVNLAEGCQVEYCRDDEEKRGKRERATDVTAPGGGALKTMPKPARRSRSRSRSRGGPRRNDSRGPQRGPPPRRRDDSRGPPRRDGPPRRRQDSRDNGDRGRANGRDDRGPPRDDSRDRRGGRAAPPPRRQDSRDRGPPARDGSRDRRPPARDDRARDESMDRQPLERRRPRSPVDDGYEEERLPRRRVAADDDKKPVVSVSRSPSPVPRKKEAAEPGSKEAQIAVEDAEDALAKAKEDEAASRKVWKKLKAAVDQECEDEVRAEEEKLGGELEAAKKGIQRGLQHTLDETEQRINDDLDQRVRDLRKEFEDKLKEEKSRVEEDSERMVSDEVAEIKEKHAKKIRAIREDAEQDKELKEERERMEAATDHVRDVEVKVERATRKLEALRGKSKEM